MGIGFDLRKNITTLDKVYTNFGGGKVKDFKVIIGLVENWYDILLFRLGIKHNLVMRLKNGPPIKIRNYDDYHKFWNSKWFVDATINDLIKKGIDISVEKNRLIVNKFGKCIKFSFDSIRQLANTSSLIKNQLLEEEYKWLDVVGKSVIDIGANIGDTAIYFALKGAKHVYAFEPYPYSYNLARENVALNGLNDKITLVNEGCGKEGVVKVSNKFKNSAASDLKTFTKGEWIRIVSLETILKRFKIRNTVLKIDCEGCEYSIILGASNETLKKIGQIMIEYHYGYINLKNKLRKAGFDVKTTIPINFINKDAEMNEMLMGMIFAKNSKNRS